MDDDTPHDRQAAQSGEAQPREAQPRETPGLLATAPLALFSIPLGLGGLALAWRQAARVMDMPPAIGATLGAVALVIFAIVVAIQFSRLVIHRHTLLAEMRHPVAGAFIAAMTMSAMLMGQILIPWAPGAGSAIWWIGTVGHALVAARLLAHWIIEPLDAPHANPAWFLPAIGIILAPQGAAMLGQTEVGWMAMGLGLVFWLIFFSVVINRLMFHDPLPERMLPSLFILMAPPALGASAWLDLGGTADNPLALALLAIALFMVIVLALLSSRFMALSYSLSWWAYTFPAAAMAGMLLRFDGQLQTTPTTVLAGAGLAAASAIIAGVALRGVAALAELVRRPQSP